MVILLAVFAYLLCLGVVLLLLERAPLIDDDVPPVKPPDRET